VARTFFARGCIQQENKIHLFLFGVNRTTGTTRPTW